MTLSSSHGFRWGRATRVNLMARESRLLNVGQAAGYVGVSAASLRNWSNRGLVPVYRTPGGQRRFSIKDLDEFMRSMRQSSGSSGDTAGVGAGSPRM
ncbi:MAG: helix-turn-helix domain-containing protein [Actinobacteria bacterium]|nr:MAG: helix-turn-helix domain-containing protein [Actinomycetota bacterium]